jgi:hypothetical protein
VGFGLARSVTKSIAATEDPEQISDAAVLSALAAKLEDTLRGVERLRTATGVVGQAQLSELCQQMNLAGDCLDDIPNRSVLRQLIEALEKEARAAPVRQNGAGQITEAVRVTGTLQQMQRTVALQLERKRPQRAGRHLIRSWEADA